MCAYVCLHVCMGDRGGGVLRGRVWGKDSTVSSYILNRDSNTQQMFDKLILTWLKS